jgi:uncharacterized RDD family membrane protein YckC
MADKRFGGFWRRFLAFLIDKILLHLVTWILYLIGLLALQLGHVHLGRASATSGLTGGMGGHFMAIYTIATLITAMAYFTWFHGTFGRTPGKMIFGLKVIQVSGDRMTLGVAFLRWVGTLVSGLVFGLGYLWIAFDGRKQGWHDKIAATLVIRAGNEHDSAATQAAQPAAPIHPPTDQEEPPIAQIPAPLPEGEHPEETRGPGDTPSL